MNLLIFVLSLIMILSAMSYSRLDSFLKSRFHAEEWRWIVQESERDLYNRHQTLCNEESGKKTKPSKPPLKAGQSQQPATVATQGSGQISLAWYLKKDFREKQPALFQSIEQLTVDFITSAWGNQPFFKDMVQEKPDFIKAMLDEIKAIADKVNGKDPKNNITKLDDLIYQTWSDPKLKIAFSRMLQEGLIFKKNERSVGKGNEKDFSPKGYQSLKDYFTSRESLKIRVWLVPRMLLKSLFPDPEVLKEVINTRETFYKDLKKEGGPTADELSARFEEAFADKSPYPELLDFKVTTTNILDR